MTAIVDQNVKEDKLVTDAEVTDEHKRWTLRNTWHWATLTDKEKDIRKLKEDMIEEKRTEAINKITDQLGDSFVDTMGTLKSLDICMVDYMRLEMYFKGQNTPKEVLDYGILSKDMVLTLVEYQSPWCWKAFAVAMWGIIQINNISLFKSHDRLIENLYYI